MKTNDDLKCCGNCCYRQCESPESTWSSSVKEYCELGTTKGSDGYCKYWRKDRWTKSSRKLLYK